MEWAFFKLKPISKCNLHSPLTVWCRFFNGHMYTICMRPVPPFRIQTSFFVFDFCRCLRFLIHHAFEVGNCVFFFFIFCSFAKIWIIIIRVSYLTIQPEDHFKRGKKQRPMQNEWYDGIRVFINTFHFQFYSYFMWHFIELSRLVRMWIGWIFSLSLCVCALFCVHHKEMKRWSVDTWWRRQYVVFNSWYASAPFIWLANCSQHKLNLLVVVVRV